MTRIMDNDRKTVSETIEVGYYHINTARLMIMRQGIIDSGIDRKNISYNKDSNI